MADSEHPAVPSRLGLALLLAGIFAASTCAIIYELLIGSTSSYFLGDSVEQYSLTIGFFLFAMGIGSYLSRWVHTDLLARFVVLELWLGVVGGGSVAALYVLYAYTRSFRYGMLLLILLLGTLIGMEVPLLTRQLRRYGSLRTTLSSVLSMDYLGSLVAALLFPYLLLPILGSLHTAAVTGMVNVAIAVAIILAFRAQLKPRLGALTRHAVLALVLLSALLLSSSNLLRRWESVLYVDRIIHSEQSRYQKIVMTRRGQHIKLFLNDHLQFSSVDEYRYHESLVHPAMELVPYPARVLIIGGGDGLSAREVLKHAQVTHIDLVDLDPAVTRLATREPLLTALNHNALSRPRVRVINEDGFSFLQRAHAPYDVIILDLPDPREESLAKLYSTEAYRLCLQSLSLRGVIVTQATSPYYARRAFWCIAASMRAAGLHVCSYHALVPSFGPWGYHLGSRQRLHPAAIKFTVPRRYLEASLFRSMLVFPTDMDELAVRPNRLDHPVLARYYREDWKRW